MGEISLSTVGVPESLRPARLLSDERLASLASRGSARAYASLYERHHQALYRYCLSIVRNPQDAQDALQSALTRALAALQASERDLAVRPWLFRIAHNEAVSILRRRRPEDRLLDEHEPSSLTVEGAADQRERLSILVSDLQALPLRQRSALLMRELSGLSIAEIAAALATSPGAAKQTLFEARSSLQAFAEGRALECETVRRAVSDGDGRVLRSRRMRAHLRGCPECSEFRAVIGRRSADLRALATPLPAAASATLLKALFAQGAAGSHAAGAATASSAGALGGHAAGSLIVKGLAGVAVLVAAGAGTAHLISSQATPARPSAGAAPTHAEHVATARDLPKPVSVPFRHESSPGAGPMPAGAASRGVPASRSEAPAIGEAQLAAAPDGAHAGAKGARGNGHRAAGKSHPTSGRVVHSHKPSRTVPRGHPRRSTGPRAKTPARPFGQPPEKRDGAPEAQAPAIEPGAQPDLPATSSAPRSGAE